MQTLKPDYSARTLAVRIDAIENEIVFTDRVNEENNQDLINCYKKDVMFKKIQVMLV